MLLDACDQPIIDDWCHCAEMIDDLHRLGISYHFQHNIIDDFLRRLHHKVFSSTAASDQVLAGVGLHHVALGFRLLRQQGHYVSTSVFDQFRDNEGSFKEELRTDTKGMLSLDEASYLSIEGEDVLEVAKVFTETHLKASMHKLTPNSELARLVEHALEQPLHWGVPKLEARHYMESLYQLQGDLRPNQRIMLEFAKLDFNHAQSLYQKELKELCKWWDGLGLGEAMKIPRGDVSLFFAWSLLLDRPQESSERVLLGKLLAMLFVVDDIYDVWGSGEDIKTLTEAFRRWDDLSFVDELPRYLKRVFLAFYNVINEIVDCVRKNHNINADQHTWKETVIFYEECMREAEKERINSTQAVSAEEYLNNKIITSGVHMVMSICFFLLGEMIRPDTADYIDRYGLTWHVAVICRISNDLDAMKDGRGGDFSYLEYYMIEHGVNMATAEAAAELRMQDEWKKLNGKCLNPTPFSRKFISASQNFCRFALVIQDWGRGRHKKILKDIVLETV